MAHKLVKLDNDRIITGDELKAILTAEGFAVPVIAPVDAGVKPLRPTVPQSPAGLTTDEILANKAIWEQYGRDLAAWTMAYQTELRRRDLEVDQFAATLAQMFTIVRGTYNRSTRTYEYSTATPVVYTYHQCAVRLAGIYKPAPVDGVGFICYKYF